MALGWGPGGGLEEARALAKGSLVQEQPSEKGQSDGSRMMKSGRPMRNQMRSLICSSYLVDLDKNGAEM